MINGERFYDHLVFRTNVRLTASAVSAVGDFALHRAVLRDPSPDGRPRGPDISKSPGIPAAVPGDDELEGGLGHEIASALTSRSSES